jgi:hypothetical protein
MTMAGAGVLSGKLRQHPFVHKFQIVANRALQGSKYAHSLRLKFHQRAEANATDHDTVYLSSSQGLQRLAHAMGMMEVAIRNFLHLSGFSIDNDKPGSRSKMTIDLTFKAFQR